MINRQIYKTNGWSDIWVQAGSHARTFSTTEWIPCCLANILADALGSNPTADVCTVTPLKLSSFSSATLIHLLNQSISGRFSQVLNSIMANNASKDLLSGTVGGAAQLICGHPFDTIKVKLQSQPMPSPGQTPRYAGAMDAIRQTVTAEGPQGLYKGMGAPLATVAAMNAVLFTARGQMETLVRTGPGIPLSVGQQVICGAGAGVAVSMLACPTELVKCRLQAQSALATGEAAAFATAGTTTGASTVVAASIKYNGPLNVAKHVLKSEGGILGLYKGLVPTLAREVPGNAVMFGVYEGLKQYLAGGRDTSGLGRTALLTSGGLSGAACWLIIYPTDVVKSVIQVDDFRQPKYSGSIDAFRKIVASEGIKGLYKGLGPAMARSIPANAACFLAYEVTRSSLG